MALHTHGFGHLGPRRKPAKVVRELKAVPKVKKPRKAKRKR